MPITGARDTITKLILLVVALMVVVFMLPVVAAYGIARFTGGQTLKWVAGGAAVGLLLVRALTHSPPGEPPKTPSMTPADGPHADSPV